MHVLSEEHEQEIKARAKMDLILGTAAERRQLRERLGFSLREIAEMTGLSVAAVAAREKDTWKRQRDSLESEPAKAYIGFIYAAKQGALEARQA